MEVRDSWGRLRIKRRTSSDIGVDGEVMYLHFGTKYETIYYGAVEIYDVSGVAELKHLVGLNAKIGGIPFNYYNELFKSYLRQVAPDSPASFFFFTNVRNLIVTPIPPLERCLKQLQNEIDNQQTL